jgi:ABC-2 type transport system ATP-binding protein
VSEAAEADQIVVRATDLVKRFGRVEALRGLTFGAYGPSIFGVVGPDGAGKTTLLRVITGILAYESGNVSTLGIDPGREPLRLKPRLGYVPQTFSMYPTLSIEENLRFVARCHGLAASDYEPRMAKLLSIARLKKFLNRRAENLSGGMKQKLALVGALLSEPKLIVLDEPNAGVDVDARAEFWDVLRECAQRALVILATNYLDEAGRCDRMIYMANGRALVVGSPDDVRRSTEVRVELLRSPLLTPAGLAARLSSERGIEVEPKGDALLLETPLEDEPTPLRLKRLDLHEIVSIQAIEPTLETALLALEKRARADESKLGISGRHTLQGARGHG